MPPDDQNPRPETVSAEYAASIIEMARELGLDRVGFTDATVLERARVALHDRVDRGLSDSMGFTFRNPERSTDPRRAVEGARSVIVAARSYNVPDEEAPTHLSATVARYARIDQYTPLRQALQKIALRLRADGYRAVVFADENDLVDREVAHRAGIGWFGKNANLLLPGAGSFFSLGSIVTTAVFAPATQPAPDGCGTCRLCIDACPTAAIVDIGVVDARRCLAWLVQKPGSSPWSSVNPWAIASTAVTTVRARVRPTCGWRRDIARATPPNFRSRSGRANTWICSRSCASTTTV